MTSGTKVMVTPYLPANTVMCSPDVYEALKAAIYKMNAQKGAEVKG